LSRTQVKSGQKREFFALIFCVNKTKDLMVLLFNYINPEHT